MKRGGRCLIPVFALGRAQELLLILDEYWQNHPELHSVPVYYASPMANKCMAVYQTYVNMMNDQIRRQIAVSNPFVFKHVQYLRGGRDAFKDVGPCVMFASPGMLQSGLSRELFEIWAPSKLNGLIIPGYVVEGTMGKFVLSEPREIIGTSGNQIPLRMSVDYISFSAHVDFAQNSEFIDILRPPHLILVHGEQAEMFRLKAALSHKYRNDDDDEEGGSVVNMTIYTPRNCEQVSLNFAGDRLLKITGKLAKTELQPETSVKGLLVGTDFDYQLIDPSELSEVTKAKLVHLQQSQTIRSRATLSLIEHVLAGLVGPANLVKVKNGFLVKDTFDLQRLSDDTLCLSWDGNVFDDLFADSIVALLVSAEITPSSVKISSGSGCTDHCHEEEDNHEKVIKIIREYLEGFYGPLEETSDSFTFIVDEIPIYVSLDTFHVECKDEEVRKSVEKAVKKMTSILSVDYII